MYTNIRRIKFAPKLRMSDPSSGRRRDLSVSSRNASGRANTRRYILISLNVYIFKEGLPLDHSIILIEEFWTAIGHWAPPHHRFTLAHPTNSGQVLATWVFAWWVFMVLRCYNAGEINSMSFDGWIGKEVRGREVKCAVDSVVWSKVWMWSIIITHIL